MKNKSNVIKATALTFVFALAMVVSVPQADAAEWPNILTSNDMTLGSTGQGVVVLQGLLSELGYLEVPMGVSLGYYGQLTKNAVAKYQVARSVSPSMGYFGSISKISMHQQFASKGWLSMLGW